jgi:hypothetical protein|tara:strand:- start:450 stop:611 length:162 start_codon:yes stop_codon:yes gene_type:complete
MDNDKKYVHAISGRIAQLRAKKKLTLRALARGGFFLLKIIIYNLIVDKVHKLL